MFSYFIYAKKMHTDLNALKISKAYLVNVPCQSEPIHVFFVQLAYNLIWQSSRFPSTHFHCCELCNSSKLFFYIRVRDFLPHTFIYECKGWDVWGLPPLEYKGLAKVTFINHNE